MKIAINGFGRIGKNVFHSLLQDPQALQAIEIVALNVGPVPFDVIASTLMHDTLLHIPQKKVHLEDDILFLDDMKIRLLQELDPIQLPWKEMGIDWVIEATGRFRKKNEAQKHRQAGAGNVLITAPALDADATVIMGVNEDAFVKGEDTIVSLGSCTTNALAPLIQVLKTAYTIETAYMTTVHAYTNDQVLLDGTHTDPRRARAASLNIIPTTTGAAQVITHIFPDLEGRIDGLSLRVPVAKVSLVDLSCVIKAHTNKKIINNLFEQHASSVLQCSGKELVSSDFYQESASVVLDTPLTTVVGSMIKLFGWYDNEWAYSCRLKDFLLYVSKK